MAGMFSRSAFGSDGSPTAFAAGGLGLPHPDVMNQAGWWGPFDINNRAFAGFSVNSVGAASLSFYDRFGNRKASISLIARIDDEQGKRHPAPARPPGAFFCGKLKLSRIVRILLSNSNLGKISQ